MSSRNIGVGLPPRPVPRSHRLQRVESTEVVSNRYDATSVVGRSFAPSHQEGNSLSTVSLPGRLPGFTMTQGTNLSRFPSRTATPSSIITPAPSPFPDLAFGPTPKIPSSSTTPTSTLRIYSTSASTLPRAATARGPAHRTLRRKRSIIRNPIILPAEPLQTTSSSLGPQLLSSLSCSNGSPGLLPDTLPAEVPVEQVKELSQTLAQPITIYPELDRYRDLPRQTVSSEALVHDLPFRLPFNPSELLIDLPPPLTPGLYSVTSSQISSQISATSASPSRFSESPGHSRNTTPLSIASQSPSLAAGSRLPLTKPGTGSPANRTRPPVTRRRAGSIPNDGDATVDPRGLSAVRESLSSITSSPILTGENVKTVKPTYERGLPSQHPTPPPRKSSTRFGSPGSKSDHSSGPEETQKIWTEPISDLTMTSKDRPPIKVIFPPQIVAPSRRIRRSTADSDLQSVESVVVRRIPPPLSVAKAERRNEPFVANSLPNLAAPVSLPDAIRQQSATRTKEVSSIRTTSFDSRSSQDDPRSQFRPPTPSSPSSALSRLPFFRRNKDPTELLSKPEPKPELSQGQATKRKGPAAGTGHEYYGRFAVGRRRSGSNSSGTRGIGGSVLSQESLGQLTDDSFLLERVNPVIIAGGEIKENHNQGSTLYQTDSSQSLAPTRPSLESMTGSETSITSGRRMTLWPTGLPMGFARSRRPSEGSDSDAQSIKPKLTLRKGLQRLKASTDQTAVKLIRPSKVSKNISGSTTSLDSGMVSDDLTNTKNLGQTRGRNLGSSLSAPDRQAKQAKRAKSPQRKWNLFGRSQRPPTVPARTATPLPAVVNKPVAYYMLDSSEQEDCDLPDFKEDVQMKPDRTRPDIAHQSQQRQPLTQQPPLLQYRLSVVTDDLIHPQPRIVEQAEESVMLVNQAFRRRGQADTGMNATGTSMSILTRPSRLPQVGRIPKVVRQGQLGEHMVLASIASNSMRQFDDGGVPSSVLHALEADRECEFQDLTQPKWSRREEHAKSTHLRIETKVVMDKERSIDRGLGARGLGARELRRCPPIRGPSDATRARELLAFSPRQNSVDTLYTTSTSFSTSLISSDDRRDTTKPFDTPVEDDIWDEYNDLLGDEHAKTLPLRQSEGVTRSDRVVSSHLSDSPESPTISITFDQARVVRKAAPCSSVYSTDLAEQIQASLTHEPTPTTSLTASETLFSGGNAESRSVRVADGQRGSSVSTKSRRSAVSSVSSNESSPMSQINLRVGSMTVSKWLTFGHVLFSPVRDDLVPAMGSLQRPSILVVDGLGNDDWSFYAAETYPAATFFNLSPRSPISEERQGSVNLPLSPPNHHQVQYKSHLDKFRFAPQSFKAVVYRFPTAASDAHYRNIISEARRVLLPGGYVEMSILDVDLNNTGTRARRAVRRLKEQIHSQGADTSLGSAADLVVRLLGSQGFVDIKTCRVGVPVASSIRRSNSVRAVGSGGVGGGEKTKATNDRTIAEMMSDDSELADESITRMVSRIGRWWYNRCYEGATLAPQAASGGRRVKSIWNDASLLHECADWGTSLKFTVCYARVPDGRARLASI